MIGVVSALFTMVTSSTWISISPVASFGFLSLRSTTMPLTCNMYSLRTSLICFASSSLNTSCVIPERSRKSMKTSAPKFLRFATQPISVTCSFTLDNLNSPFVCVLFMLILLFFMLSTCTVSIFTCTNMFMFFFTKQCIHCIHNTI